MNIRNISKEEEKNTIFIFSDQLKK